MLNNVQIFAIGCSAVLQDRHDGGITLAREFVKYLSARKKIVSSTLLPFLLEHATRDTRVVLPPGEIAPVQFSRRSFANVTRRLPCRRRRRRRRSHRKSTVFRRRNASAAIHALIASRTYVAPLVFRPRRRTCMHARRRMGRARAAGKSKGRARTGRYARSAGDRLMRNR